MLYEFAISDTSRDSALKLSAYQCTIKSMSSLFFISGVHASKLLARFSDKCLLPQSILEQVTGEISEFPHPLVFEVKSDLGTTHIGVKEFTAPEETLVVPENLLDVLGEGPVTIQLQPSVPKATFLQLKPAQFYPHITNWKYYLESNLSRYYTTLKKHSTFSIYDHLAGTVVDLFVEDSNDTLVTVIDTDTILDVLPLNDIMAAQQLNQMADLLNLENIPELVELSKVELVPFNQKSIPTLFKVNLKNKTSSFSLLIQAENEVDPFNIDMLVALDKFVKLENFLYQTMLQDFVAANKGKRVDIDIKDDLISNHIQKFLNYDECYIYVAVFAWDHTAEANIILTEHEKIETTSELESTVKCSNCHKQIAKNNVILHEAFCRRNNVRCSCGEVFLQQVPSSHWHCDICDPIVYGDSSLFKLKHNKLYHEGPYTCPACEDQTEYSTLIDLVEQHKSRFCPARLHECMFCHLILPQEESDYQDRFANLTHHENQCGNKTTECFECGKVLKRKDLISHSKIHLMDKVELNTEKVNKCSNEVCVNLINGTPDNDLNLCDSCYGPLYATVYDPTNSKLQNRIERKYMIQLTRGCGNAWCDNTECVSGNPSKRGALIKDTLAHIHQDLLSRIVKPSLPISAKTVPHPPNAFWFCINESIQKRKGLVQRILDEGRHSQNMVLRAVASQKDEESVRVWLSQNGL